MARAMQIHDVLNDLTIWGDIFPRSYSENAIIAKPHQALAWRQSNFIWPWLSKLQPDLFTCKRRKPRRFLMRCKTSFSNEVKKFVSSKKTNVIVTIYPSLESIERLRELGYIVTQKSGIKIRMLKVVLPESYCYQ